MSRPLRLFNSLGRRVEEFHPAGAEVRVFSCGPLVYAFPHLGVLRAYVCVDLIRRALRWKGLPARHVTMITDVNRGRDDAGRGSEDLAELADFYTRVFLDDLAAMNVLPAHENPRASAYLDEMVAFATELDRKGFAYRTPAGLYFDTAKVDYGTLVPIDPAALREGVRVEATPGRRNRTDFALWRLADRRTSPMGWDSPWGWGLPGGHLACSTIGIALLGRQVDIHTGGKHHRQLHHVNEIAQSEAYLGEPWVRSWVHHDALTFGAQPMVRGRAPRLADVTAAGIHPMTCRLLLLGGHYRSRQSFTPDALAGAGATLRNLAARVRRLGGLPAVPNHRDAATRLAGAGAEPAAWALLDRLDAGICADLNAPEVLACLHEILRAPGLRDGSRRVLAAAADGVLGLGLSTLDPAELAMPVRGDTPATRPGPDTVDELIAARAEARRRRDWARADEIRSTLVSLGVRVADAPVGRR